MSPDSNLPTQLRVVGATDLERRVLDAGSRELPSVELTQKMRRALGLSIAVGAMTAAAAKSSTAAAATSFAWPAISVGMLALAVTGAVVGLRSTADHHISSKPASTIAAPPISAATALPAARAMERIATVHAHHHAAAGTTPSDLRAEIALVDAARSAVASGADDRALALLNRYDSSYRAGTFRPEATALRIEALDHVGRTVQARALARRFIVMHPDSPLSDRVARVTGVTTH